MYDFDFSSVKKQFESYNGINVRLRYFVRVLVKRGSVTAKKIQKEEDFWVQVCTTAPEINNSIKMETTGKSSRKHGQDVNPREVFEKTRSECKPQRSFRENRVQMQTP